MSSDKPKNEALADLNVLANEIRLNILNVLKNNSEKKLSFNELADQLKIDRSKLSYHITLLKNANFINNQSLLDEKKGKHFSFYALSAKGKTYLETFQNISQQFLEREKDFLKPIEKP